MWDWIVQILFQALELIQRFAGDWGLSIIILVVIIRLLLTPMMLKSIKSTARMQVLQPSFSRFRSVTLPIRNVRPRSCRSSTLRTSSTPLAAACPC